MLNKMRSLPLIILGLFIFAPVSPAMAEYLQGKVVRIDHEKGEMEIILSQAGHCRMANGNNDAGSEKSEQAGKQERVIIKAPWFPRCLADGTEIYARGEFSPEHKDLFVAEDVFPCRGRGGHDPTGVRSRFHHHRRKMMRHKGGEMNE